MSDNVSNMIEYTTGIQFGEATANIDLKNEVYIQEAIKELVRNKTLVIIAHTLNIIRGR